MWLMIILNRKYLLKEIFFPKSLWYTDCSIFLFQRKLSAISFLRTNCLILIFLADEKVRPGSIPLGFHYSIFLARLCDFSPCDFPWCAV